MTSGSKKHLKIALASALMLTSPVVLAASEKTPWTAYFLIGMTISIVVASILSSRHKNAESAAIKVMLGGLYFWVVTFIQLTVFAVIHYFNR